MIRAEFVKRWAKEDLSYEERMVMNAAFGGDLSARFYYQSERRAGAAALDFEASGFKVNEIKHLGGIEYAVEVSWE